MPSFHPSSDKLFELGIDPPPAACLKISHRTGLGEVESYSNRIRQAIDQALEQGAVPDEAWHMIIEHRLMHAETFTYMLHNLPPERKIEPPGVAARILGPPVAQALIEIPAGSATLGLERGNGFGWDNEFDQHSVDVPAFAIGTTK
jgi:hypothetical protein